MKVPSGFSLKTYTNRLASETGTATEWGDRGDRISVISADFVDVLKGFVVGLQSDLFRSDFLVDFRQ